MLPVLDQLLGTFFEHLKNMYLTWIASVDKKVGDFRKLGVVDSAKFAYSGRFALVPCTVYLVFSRNAIILKQIRFFWGISWASGGVVEPRPFVECLPSHGAAADRGKARDP